VAAFHCRIAISMFHNLFPTLLQPICFTICFTICLCISPDLDGNRGTTKMCPKRPTKGPKTQIRSHDMFHDMFHDMLVHESGLRRAQGAKNEILSHRDPQKVSKPKYEATALCSHRSIGYPNPTNGQYTPHYGTPDR
jgi:hypothetical protein